MFYLFAATFYKYKIEINRQLDTTHYRTTSSMTYKTETM